MKSTRRSLLVAGVIALLALVLGAGVVWAATAKLDVMATVTVVEASATVKAYSDEACTTSLTTALFGNVAKGCTSAPLTVYVRNEGNVPVCITFTGATGLPAGCTVTSGASPTVCAVGPMQVVPFTLYLHVADNAAAGNATGITLGFTSAQS